MASDESIDRHDSNWYMPTYAKLIVCMSACVCVHVCALWHHNDSNDITDHCVKVSSLSNHQGIVSSLATIQNTQAVTCLDLPSYCDINTPTAQTVWKLLTCLDLPNYCDTNTPTAQTLHGICWHAWICPTIVISIHLLYRLCMESADMPGSAQPLWYQYTYCTDFVWNLLTCLDLPNHCDINTPTVQTLYGICWHAWICPTIVTSIHLLHRLCMESADMPWSAQPLWYQWTE